MLPIDPQSAVEALRHFQATVRDLVDPRHTAMAICRGVTRSTSADTIYQIDSQVEPLLEEFCRGGRSRRRSYWWPRESRETTAERESRYFLKGCQEDRARFACWSIQSMARGGSCTTSAPPGHWRALRPTRGRRPASATSKSAVMIELPTSKMGQADVLWAIKGRGAQGRRFDLTGGNLTPLRLQPSSATDDQSRLRVSQQFLPRHESSRRGVDGISRRRAYRPRRCHSRHGI